MKISAGKIVALEYELLTESGETYESSEQDGPLVYMHGNKEIPELLEGSLDGGEAGLALELSLEPDQAFGQHDVDGIVTIPRDEFPEGPQLIPGEWIVLNVTPDDPSDAETAGEEDEDAEELEASEIEMRVVEINDEAVILDGNHPLAGQKVTFKVKVLEIREPTHEDLHGHEDCGHDHNEE